MVLECTSETNKAIETCYEAFFKEHLQQQKVQARAGASKQQLNCCEYGGGSTAVITKELYSILEGQAACYVNDLSWYQLRAL